MVFSLINFFVELVNNLLVLAETPGTYCVRRTGSLKFQINGFRYTSTAKGYIGIQAFPNIPQEKSLKNKKNLNLFTLKHIYSF